MDCWRKMVSFFVQGPGQFLVLLVFNISVFPDAHGPSYGGVGPSYGGVWGLNSLGF